MGLFCAKFRFGNVKWERCGVYHVTSMGQRKKSSQQESNPRSPKHLAGTLSTELLYRETRSELGHLLGLYVTRFLHTDRISNMDVVLCDDELRKMEKFYDGKEKIIQVCEQENIKAQMLYCLYINSLEKLCFSLFIATLSEGSLVWVSFFSGHKKQFSNSMISFPSALYNKEWPGGYEEKQCLCHPP